eukprot:5006307-Amphidinium_carterae.1
MFCVSNKQGRNFVMLVMCAACLFTSVSFARGDAADAAAGMDGRFACARSAWVDTRRRLGA